MTPTVLIKVLQHCPSHKLPQKEAIRDPSLFFVYNDRNVVVCHDCMELQCIGDSVVIRKLFLEGIRVNDVSR